MTFRYSRLTQKKVGVVGAGHIGPDIALHFAQHLHRHGVSVVVIDVAADALDKAREKIARKLERQVTRGRLSAEEKASMESVFSFTVDYGELAGAGLVVEAATEDLGIKRKIFAQIEAIVAADSVLLSNSSHMQPEEVFADLREPARCMMAHYFFPAERNVIVEIVPGQSTDPALAQDVMAFYEALGKAPILVKSSYGFAIDPIFEGLVQYAILCREAGLGTEKQIDAMAVKTLGMGIGHFAILTSTNGNPITHHGLDLMHDRVGNPWFRSPQLLSEKVARGEGAWEIAARGEEVTVPDDVATALRDGYLGCYFALASYIMDRGIVDLDDLNMGVRLALDMKAPFTMMNEIGLDAAYAKVQAFCAAHPDFPMPQSIAAARDAGGWKLSEVVARRERDVLVLKIRRPRELNAVNRACLASLSEHFERAGRDASIRGVVLTGHGIKAFVAGADITMLAQSKTAEDAYRMSRTFQQLTLQMEALGKPVVCAMNGLAFGGGVELALACTARVAQAGLKVLAGMPEVRLGIIPGGGGTQRLPRLIGVEAAARMLRTGQSVSAQEALASGLVDQVAEDCVNAAITLARQLAQGSGAGVTRRDGPVQAPAELPAVDLDGLSRSTDAILCEAIVKGAALSLSEGLELEARLSGRCMETEDARIGISNFIKNGPRVAAQFVHR